jgi:hypothetical protein
MFMLFAEHGSKDEEFYGINGYKDFKASRKQGKMVPRRMSPNIREIRTVQLLDNDF